MKQRAAKISLKPFLKVRHWLRVAAKVRFSPFYEHINPMQ
jgi:hypothetical protein